MQTIQQSQEAFKNRLTRKSSEGHPLNVKTKDLVNVTSCSIPAASYTTAKL